MEVSSWIAEHWFDLVQTGGIITGFLFTAYTIREEVRGRRVSNSIAISDQHREIWNDFYARPELLRVLESDPDLQIQPISDEEEYFVTRLILHLGTVYRAMNDGEFVELEGLQKDVQDFFTLPIPRTVWKKAKTYQDENFVRFLESSLQK